MINVCQNVITRKLWNRDRRNVIFAAYTKFLKLITVLFACSNITPCALSSTEIYAFSQNIEGLIISTKNYEQHKMEISLRASNVFENCYIIINKRRRTIISDLLP
jgi:hypothetical protein